jgi:secondary thiamine-phosphate synthase enzyme
MIYWGVTINWGTDPAVCKDIITKPDEMVPLDAGYHHLEGKSDSRIKAPLISSSVSIIAEKSSLVIGTWQRILFCEFYGPGSRRFF